LSKEKNKRKEEGERHVTLGKRKILFLRKKEKREHTAKGGK